MELSYGYSSEKEKQGKPWIEKLTITYAQGPDCEQDDDLVQAITLTSMDNGMAPFIRISIPEDSDTKFWSVGDINDLKIIFEDFEKKLNYIENERLQKQE